MDAARTDFGNVGLPFRPRIFEPEETHVVEQLPEPVESGSEQSSPEKVYTRLQTLYLKTMGVSKGVLQIHRVPRLIIKHAGFIGWSSLIGMAPSGFRGRSSARI